MNRQSDCHQGRSFFVNRPSANPMLATCPKRTLLRQRIVTVVPCCQRVHLGVGRKAFPKERQENFVKQLLSRSGLRLLVIPFYLNGGGIRQTDRKCYSREASILGGWKQLIQHVYDRTYWTLECIRRLPRGCVQEPL